MDLTFDCYGTLLDTRPIRNWFLKISQRNNLDGQAAWHQFESWEDRLMYGEPTLSYLELLKQNLVYIDMTLKAGTLFSDQLPQLIAVYRALEPWPEVVTTLRQLRLAGNRVILMSNSTPELMTAHLKSLGHQVDQVILPEQTGCYKPDIKFFKYAAQQVSHDHIHVAMGYWWDVIPCRKMGWPVVWINRNGLTAFADNQLTATLPNLTGLPKLVQQFSEAN